MHFCHSKTSLSRSLAPPSQQWVVFGCFLDRLTIWSGEFSCSTPFGGLCLSVIQTALFATSPTSSWATTCGRLAISTRSQTQLWPRSSMKNLPGRSSLKNSMHTTAVFSRRNLPKAPKRQELVNPPRKWLLHWWTVSKVLYCTALHCTALHCTALHCLSLHRTPCEERSGNRRMDLSTLQETMVQQISKTI